MRLYPDVQQQKLSGQPKTPQARVAMLRNLFKDAGCEDRLVQQQVKGKLPNLMCTTRGAGDSVILVTAPLDYKAKGDEAAMHWSDLVMMPILAESLSSVITRHKIVFAAFGGGHDGESGAQTYLDHLTPDQRKKIDAVVALDHIGRYAPVYSVPASGPGIDISTGRYDPVRYNFNPWSLPITRPITAAAERWKYPVPQKTGEFGIDLIHPFHHDGIPAITFTSPAWTIVRMIGNQPIRDYRSKLDPKVYNDTYLFLSVYLLLIDRELGDKAAGPSPEVAGALLSAQLEGMESLENLRKQAPIPAVQAPEVSQPQVPAAPAPVSDPNAPVFKTTARLVQVDVVVTDKKGRPIEGLNRDDFRILQDGREQKASVFEAHTAVDAAAPEDSQPVEAAKPHELGSYSNEPTAANQSWNIILFDMLNTPTSDQQLARKQLQKIAQALPVGQPVALFLLANKLVMAQGFTRDPNAMMLAVKQLQTERSQILTTQAELQHEQGIATYAAQTMAENLPSAAAGASQNVADFQTNTVNRLLEPSRKFEALRTDERAIFTLDAFASISRAMAGYPGRKNLIWLSGDFPIRIEPNPNMDDKWRYRTDYTERLTRTDALLTESRVAVYPVDIRGIQTRGMDISTGAEESRAFVGYNDGSTPSTSPMKETDLTATQGFTAMNERKTMTEVAYQTGGHAFINTNDFAWAIARAIEDGSTYYTLAYAPDTKDDKPAYHRIEVKLNRGDTRLSYRRGYYSQPEKGTQQVGLAALQASLQLGMPPATMLFFNASVKPPDASRKTVEIDYLIKPSNITLGDAANGAKHVVIDCMAVAFDKDGKEAGHASDTLDGAIPATALQAALNQGLPAKQELSLEPGVYNLRIGVQDRQSQNIGTLTIPISVR